MLRWDRWDRCHSLDRLLLLGRLGLCHPLDLSGLCHSLDLSDPWLLSVQLSLYLLLGR